MRDLNQKAMIYRATYIDERGRETTEIHNDGETLRMTVRGVVFEGESFDDFEPMSPVSLDGLGFTVNLGALCDCVIECEIPVSVMEGDHVESAFLHARLELGAALPNQGIDKEVLGLRLVFGGKTYASKGGSGHYEDELLELQNALPEGTSIKACITCAFSDYSPCGNGLFGGLACFRTVPEKYLAVESKAALFALWDERAGFVQETYLCDAYRRRKPGAGYRG